MKKLEQWFHVHRRIAVALILLFFLLLTGSSFPIYNFTKNYPTTLEFTILFVNVSVYAYLGAFLSRLRPKRRFGQVFLIQLGMILGGMLCRYLLGFGEVSNIYNFTPVNIALHLAASLTISSLSWWRAGRHSK